MRSLFTVATPILLKEIVQNGNSLMGISVDPTNLMNAQLLNTWNR